jgi:hypothetical protein
VLAVGPTTPAGKGFAPSLVPQAAQPAAATLNLASSPVTLPAVRVAAADGTAAAPVSAPALPRVFSLAVAPAAAEAFAAAPAAGSTPTSDGAAARTRPPVPHHDELRLESEATAAPPGFAAPDRGLAPAAPPPRSFAALPSGLHPAAIAPPQPLVISSDTLGAVTVGLDGGPQDLRLRLDAGPLAAGLLAADAPRLIADLAAQGVRLYALDIGGQSLNPALISASSSSPGTGFGQQPQHHQHQQRSPAAMPAPALRADAGAIAPPPVSDRYA